MPLRVHISVYSSLCVSVSPPVSTCLSVCTVSPSVNTGLYLSIRPYTMPIFSLLPFLCLYVSRFPLFSLSVSLSHLIVRQAVPVVLPVLHSLSPALFIPSNFPFPLHQSVAHWPGSLSLLSLTSSFHHSVAYIPLSFSLTLHFSPHCIHLHHSVTYSPSLSLYSPISLRHDFLADAVH